MLHTRDRACLNKTRYDSEAEALAAPKIAYGVTKQVLATLGEEGFKLRAYQCEWCGMWHRTKQTTQEYERNRHDV